MGRVFLVELDGRVYRCKFCKSHLALADELVSKAFHCRRGKAYLFNSVVNIIVGAKEERMMLSGMHTVADIFCCCCGQIVGWKYMLADAYKAVSVLCYSSSDSNGLMKHKPFAVVGSVSPNWWGKREQSRRIFGHLVAREHLTSWLMKTRQEAAQDKNQKYKEGKFVLERGRIIDGIDSDFYLDSRPTMSDGEDV